jgi:hypothetical protein
MAISTSGVSVPQLGQTIDPSIYGNQNAPKATSLGDILDLTGKNLEVQKKKALLPSEIEQGQANARKATAEANTLQLQNFQAHLTNTIQDQQRLINKPDLTAQDIIDSVKVHAKNAGTPDAAVQQALAGLPASGNPSQLKAWLAQSMARSLNAQGQLDALYPKASQTNLGGVTAPLAAGNQLLSSQTPGTQAGPATALGLPPTTLLTAQPGDGTGLPPDTKYYIGANGNAIPQNGAPIGGGGQGGVTPDQMNKPSNQQRPAVSALSPQTSTNLEIGNNLVNKSREQAGNAVRIESAANQAIQLSQVTDTGQGAQLWNNLKGNYVGMPEFDPAHPAANYQILGHVLTNETNLLAQNPAYGAGTMASHGGTGKQIEQAVQTAGKTDWNPEAIQYTSRYNRALAYGVQMFNHGVDQSQTISNKNPLYANEYQQKWNSNLNLDSIRLADGKRNAGIDPAGLTQITKELGGEKSERYKKAQEDLRVINNLATRGK